MNSLTPYLFFNGQCREALAFYVQAMGGKVDSLMTFAESPEPVPSGVSDQVMHAQFSVGPVVFMASDTMSEKVPHGGPVALNLDFSDPDEQARVFHELAEGGEITMALQDTFWGSRFGMVTDRYGIQWMLSCGQ